MNQGIMSASLALAGALLLLGSSAGSAADWAQSGNDIRNSRHQADESTLGPGNVGNLKIKWAIETGGDVSSTPAVEGPSIYFGDWGGNIFRVRARDGAIEWSVPLSSYTGIPGDWTRHTPAVTDDSIILGNQIGRFGQGGAKLVAINKKTGAHRWTTQLDPLPSSIVTSSPTLFGNVVYVGVASFEEGIAAIAGEYYPCCLFRGSVVAVDVKTGRILWQTYMAPPGFSGNAVWGSSPAIDTKRGQLYVATGNNYSAPQGYLDCVAGAATDAAKSACNPPDNYFDSVLALDLKTGRVNWASRVLPFDTWTVACAPFLVPPQFLGPNYQVNCLNGGNPADAGPDHDFAQGPILYKAKDGKDRLGIGQKSSVYWILDPATGQVLSSTRTGPGGLAGGHQWGSASDGLRIYTSDSNSNVIPYTLVDGTTTSAGIFSALDAATGAILWQIANPAGEQAGSPASVANGVMYVCSMGSAFGFNQGQMYAIDGATGQVLWTFASGSSCGGGASIANGTVYWGTGYTSLGGSAGSRLFAFGL